MAKKSVVKPKRAVTRRQLSYWQRQKRRRRIIIALGTTVIAAVVGLVIGGLYCQWYPSEVKPLKETVIEVNDTSFNMSYYIDALNNYIGGYSYLAEYYLDITKESIQRNELIKQGAEELGFTVSDDEINEELEESGLPDNQAASDTVRANLLLGKLEEGYFGPKIPINAEHRHAVAMFLESEVQVAEVRDRLEAGETFADIASELSLDSTTKEGGGDLDWQLEGILNRLLDTTVLESGVFSSEVGGPSQTVYDDGKSKNIGYWLIKVVELGEEGLDASVQVMLLSSEEEAQEVLYRMKAGEEFIDLAEEFSQYGEEGSRGEERTIVGGDMSTAFDDYVFDPETELDVVSGVIRDEEVTTTGGYWLFEVLGSEIMDISENNRQTMVAYDMNEWILSLWEDPENTIVDYLDEEKRAFVLEKVASE